jgi:hypothetical protein
LHERDFHAWALEQARLIRDGRFGELDLQYLAEEVEDMGKAETRALKSELVQLLSHLLKLGYSPAEDPRGHWEDEVAVHRLNIAAILQDSPGLMSRLDELFAQAWSGARGLALVSLRRDGITELPETNPFSLDQSRDPDFWPARRA